MAKTETAILAGGCFWGMQDLIRKLPGVTATRVGYSGGDVQNATYRNHGSHAEAIEVVCEPPSSLTGSFSSSSSRSMTRRPRTSRGNDIGTSYRSGIYYLSDEQRRVAEETVADVNASGLWPGPVVTEVRPAGPFWEAEPEHQDYLLRYAGGYTCHYPRPDWKLPRRASARTA
jgi:peptide-methionine (S)-S-oxide reductase